MSTNEWHFVQDEGTYIDFDKEVCSFPDEGNTSVDLRLAFNRETHSAYISISTHNNSGDVGEMSGQINLTWEQGIAVMGDRRLEEHLT